MTWSELDHERGTWTILGERTKNHRAHTLALPAAAWSILDTVPRRGEHLFGRRGFTNWGVTKVALDERCGIAPWTLHDLRRTTATRMADLGILPHVIEVVLNHVGSRKGVVGIYNRSSYEREARAALALWADHVRSIVEGGERKIIPMRSQ
jgi:integrase